MHRDLMQIGEVAQRTGLSLRTIRYYEEVGLVAPSARTRGGFRLYTDADARRLSLVKRMKPLDFSLEEMREVLALLDRLEPEPVAHVDSPRSRAELADRLERYRAAAEQRCASLREQLAGAERFTADIEQTLTRDHREVLRSR